jgi:hypothetical protein
LYDVVANSPDEWETYLASARSAVTALDHLRFFRDPQRFAEQVWILHGLQDYAFHDPDSGSIRDIAEWAQASWLKVLRNYPENEQVLTGMFNCRFADRLNCDEHRHLQPNKLHRFRALTDQTIIGLGRNWLQSAQATLARIAREEGNDSSSSGSGQAGNILRGCEAIDEGSKTDEVAATTSADPRRQGLSYVEARGFLQPAVDFYARAVRSADALGTTSGELLAQVSIFIT